MRSGLFLTWVAAPGTGRSRSPPPKKPTPKSYFLVEAVAVGGIATSGAIGNVVYEGCCKLWRIVG